MAELTRPADPAPLSRHGAWILLGLLAFAVFGGGLIAPWIFNGLLRLGRAVKALDFLREVEFESVVSRCVLVLLIAGLFPAARLAGFQRFRDLGFGGTPSYGRSFVRGFALGVVTLLAVVGSGWALGAYVPNVEPRMTRPGKLLLMVAGACTVGITEEMIFRGFIHRVFAASWRAWIAVAASGAFFSGVHFAKPEPDIGVVHGRWDSGLSMIRHMFNADHETYHYFPYAATLLVMGMVLALRFQRTGWKLGHVAGLHAGWVLVMLMWGYCFDRADDSGWLFGQSDVVAKCPAALLLSLGFWPGRGCSGCVSGPARAGSAGGSP
ncbi:MAG: type II CAAX endopeptidase family protein [Kiritimatiellia bacterium]